MRDSRALDIAADLADGDVKTWHEWGRVLSVTDDSLVAEARPAVQPSPELVARCRQQRERLTNAMADCRRLAQTPHPDYAVIADLAKNAVAFDVSDVVALGSRGDCDLPADLPTATLPFPVTLFVMDANAAGGSSTTRYPMWWWWLATQADASGPVLVPYQGLWLNWDAGVIRLLGCFVEPRSHEADQSWREAIMRTATLICSCRNVDAKVIPMPAAMTRQRRRNGQHPITSYRLLELFPKPSPRAGPRANDHIHGKRFHAVRGHFKRTKWGTFWWHPFWRGRRDLGIVIKDYVVAG